MKSNDTKNTRSTLLQEGISAAKTGNKLFAESLLLRAVERDPENEITWLWLAYISENVNKTIEYLRQVLSINPQNHQALTSLKKALLQQGIAHAKAGSNALARESLLEVTQLNPADEAAWLWLASVADNTTDTVTCLRQVLEINPSNQHAVSWLDSINNQTPVESKQEIIDREAEPQNPDEIHPALSEELVEIHALPDLNQSPEERGPVGAEPHFESSVEPAEHVTEQHPRINAVIAPVDGTEGYEEKLAEMSASVQELESRLKETETKWLRETQSRSEAEQLVNEIQEELYRSLNMRREAERLNMKAEVAIRDSEMMKARVIEIEAQLRDLEAKWRQEAHAREAAEQWVQEIKEESERILKEKSDALSTIGASEKIARAEAVAKAKEAEAWVQELGVKWREEIDAREAAEKRIEELEAELKRTQNLLLEAEIAWTKYGDRAENGTGDLFKLKRNLEEAEKRTRELEEQLTDVGLQLEVETRARMKAESRIRRADPDNANLPLSSPARDEEGEERPDSLTYMQAEERRPLSPFETQPMLDQTMAQAARFSDSEGYLDSQTDDFDYKGTAKMVLFVLLISGSLLSLIYVTYTLLQDTR